MNKRTRIGKEDRKVMLLLAGVMLAFVLYLALRPSPSIAEDHVAKVEQNEKTLPLATGNIGSEDSPRMIKAVSSDTLPIRTERYPGPPERVKYPSKLQAGATIDLNSADTLLLQRVPGIGESFARRIYKYRELLGGYYVVEQLQEVYGMDRERYDQIVPFFVIKTSVKPLVISGDSIPRHPYLQFRHQKVLRQLCQKHASVSWKMLMDSGAFSHDDSLRLAPYLVLPHLIESEENLVSQ